MASIGVPCCWNLREGTDRPSLAQLSYGTVCTWVLHSNGTLVRYCTGFDTANRSRAERDEPKRKTPCLGSLREVRYRPVRPLGGTEELARARFP